MSTKGQLVGTRLEGVGLGFQALAAAAAVATPPGLAAIAALDALAPPGPLHVYVATLGATGRTVVLTGIGALLATTGHFAAMGLTVVLQGLATIPKPLLQYIADRRQVQKTKVLDIVKFF